MRKKIHYENTIVVLLLVIISIPTIFSLFSNQIDMDDKISKKMNNNELIEEKLQNSADFSWDLIPNVNNKYFSPDTTPGKGDEVIYSFSTNQANNYSLNISAYYGIIENYPGPSHIGDSSYSSAYLMPNGTWVIATIRMVITGFMEGAYIMTLGIGTNISNFEWSDVGEVNQTESIAVAGDESGKIRIVYAEINDTSELEDYEEFQQIKYFSSDNWGKDWDRGVLKDYREYSSRYSYGISLAAFQGNFTCVWGATNTGNRHNSTIVSSQDTIISGGWTTPKNITSLETIGTCAPQVFYNQTNGNGTIYLGYNRFYPGNWVVFNMIQLKDGLYFPATSNWTDYTGPLVFEGSGTTEPLLKVAKDKNTDHFYFLSEEGIKNATWGQALALRDLDRFQTLYSSDAMIYANNGPKCYTGGAKADSGKVYPGILDCLQSFHVITTEEELQAYEKAEILFNGKDNDGNPRYAHAYHFDLSATDGNTLEYELIVYVDNKPPLIDYSISNSKISPFTSPGVNDQFTIDIISDRSASASLNVRGESSLLGYSNVSSNDYPIGYPVICGEGINKYLFYFEYEGVSGSLTQKIMLSISEDGGISWNNPKEITRVVADSYEKLFPIVSGRNIYLWTDSNALFISSDSGNTFYKQRGSLNDKDFLGGVTDDLICWAGSSNGTSEFLLNNSIDFGRIWEPFISLEIEDPQNYTLGDLSYDSISGNYSLLLLNLQKDEVLFVSFTNDSAEYTISTNILSKGIGNPFSGGSGMSSFSGLIKLDSRILNSEESEWIITTSGENMFSYETGFSNLTYKRSNDGITFTPWENITEITGDNIAVLHQMYMWDINYPEGEFPSLVTGFLEGSLFEFDAARHLTTTCFSTYVFGTSKELDAEVQEQISFNGVSNYGDILPDSNYTWELNIIDRAGYELNYMGNLSIDNNAPTLCDYANLTSPQNPYPNNATKITIPVYEVSPDTGLLYWRNQSGDWYKWEMNIDTTNAPYVNFTATIPSQSDDVTQIFWKVEINDTSGNLLEIDNDGQLFSYGRGVYEYVKESGMLSPTLYDQWAWSYIFTSGADHITKVWIERLYADNTEDNITINPSGTQNNKFETQIDYDLTHESAIYKFKFKSDMGQTFTIEEIELKKPLLRLEEELSPPETLDLSEEGSLIVTYSVPEYDKYIQSAYIKYKYDSEDNWHKEELTEQSNLYSYTFEEIPEDATELTYTIILTDEFGNEITLEDPKNVNILPKIPSWEMTPQEQIVIPIISLSVGVFCGIVYSVVMKQKKEDKELFEIAVAKADMEQNNSAKSELKKDAAKKIDSSASRKLLMGISLAGFGASIGLALLSILVLGFPAAAMFLFALSFLSAVLLWVLLSAHFVEKMFERERGAFNINLTAQLILSVVAIVIFVSLLAIFLTGNTIAWWRVRVNEQSYNLGDIIIPRALTTVATTFFSSIFLLTWSTFKDVSNKAKKLKMSEENNENPLSIIKSEKEAISKVQTNIGKKGILFVAIIGITIIFASDLSVYAFQGMLIIIPFVIGAIVTLILLSFLKGKKKESSEEFVLDRVISCPHCRKKTPLGGNFCEQCGKQLLLGKRFSEGAKCAKCGRFSSQQSQFCRFCGNTLASNK